MSKCKHAEEMLEYAKDAMETDKPWERWEIFIPADEYGDDRWSDCGHHPPWNEHHKYRRKPRAININGHEVPEPVRRPLACGAKYFATAVGGICFASEFYWRGDEADNRLLEHGLVHLTEEAAIAHAKALLSFTTKPEVSDE